jgi:glycosyltransferase involved in cell wall biosynthesis
MVAVEFGKFAGDADSSPKILPQGLYLQPEHDPSCRSAVRDELGLPPDARIVLGLGSADLRKGFDLFVTAAASAAARDSGLYFLWVGAVPFELKRWFLPQDQTGRTRSNFRHVEFTNDVAPYLGAADLFWLSSREDPFPSTVLEALSIGLPVVGFENCSGAQDLIAAHGALVPEGDIFAVLDAIQRLLSEDAATAERAAKARRDTIAKDFRFDQYGFRLLQLLNPSWRPVSVVVPNYNYQRYLADRMESILNQTVPVFEIIVLDDCSGDASLAELDRIRTESNREFSIVVNSKNSGSVLNQWHKGVQLASGEFVWIAEADDLARPEFLHRLTTALKPNRVLFAFCDSAQIDGEGALLGDSYQAYYQRDGSDLLTRDSVTPAREFAMLYLSVRNLILNVSSLVARREPLLASLEANLDALKTFSFAGDWQLYADLCLNDGDVAFVADSLNVHRRHQASAVHTAIGKAHIDEVRRVHAFFRKAYGEDSQDRNKRKRYLKELEAHFGLDGKLSA